MKVVVWKNVGVLRGLAICMVVLNHAVRNLSSLYLSAAQEFDPQRDPFNAFWILGLRVLTPFCVPAFVFSSAFLSHRFVRTKKQARQSAWAVARYYLIWSLPLFAIIALYRGEFHAKQALVLFVNGGPPTAYWFLVLMVQLLVVFMLLRTLVERYARLLFGLMIALQISVWVAHYAGLLGHVPVELAFVVRPILLMPVFIAGMLASQYSKRIVSFFEPRRRLLVIGAAIMGCVSFAESWWLATEGGWMLGAVDHAAAEERAPATLFALFVIAAVLARKSGNNPRSRWFNQVGMASFGIFLMVDMFHKVLLAAAWRASALHESAHLFVLVLVPVFFVVGIWGPMTVMKYGDRLLGPRAKLLW